MRDRRKERKKGGKEGRQGVKERDGQGGRMRQGKTGTPLQPFNQSLKLPADTLLR